MFCCCSGRDTKLTKQSPYLYKAQYYLYIYRALGGLVNYIYIIYYYMWRAATAAEHAHHLSNKEITTSNWIYGTTCPRLNVYITTGKPARHRRVAVDSKVGQHIRERNTTTNLITGDPTTTTKGQQLEIAETYRHPKRHQGRFREGRRHTPTYKSSICGLIGRTNYLGTLSKTQ